MAKFQEGRINPYKGIPKSEWGRVKTEQQAAKKHAKMPDVPSNAFQAVAPMPLPPDIPMAPPAVNSEPAIPDHIPRNLFSGAMKSLDVMGVNGSFEDPIPGYTLYWFNDIADRIPKAQLSGWSFVDKNEVMLMENVVGNNDLGSQVSKVVNPNLNPPTKAYLMKKPNWLCKVHDEERETYHRRIDSALRTGTLGRTAGDGQYTAEEDPKSIMPKIEISSNLYKENRNG